MSFCSKAAIWHAVILVLLDSIALGIFLGVMPNVQVGFFNHGDECKEEGDNDRQECKDAADKVVLAAGIVNGIMYLCTFIGAPVMGALADSFGRYYPYIASQAMTLMPCVALLLYSTEHVSLYMYYAFHILTGFCDTTSISLAYISDISIPSKRSASYGFMLGVVMVGIVLGPIFGTLLTRTQVFSLSVGLAVTATIVALLIPDSLPIALRKPFDRTSLNPFHSLKILFRKRLFIKLAICTFCNSFILMGIFTSLFLYLKTRFGTTEKQNSYLAALSGACAVLSQAILLRILVRFYNNRRIMLIGMTFSFIGPVILSVIWEFWMAYVYVIINSISWVAFPAIGALKANNVSEQEQGQLQGALASARALGSTAGPLVCAGVNALFTSNVGGLPTLRVAPYIVCAGVAFISLMVAYTIREPVVVKDLPTENDSIPSLNVDALIAAEDSPYHPTYTHVNNSDAQIILVDDFISMPRTMSWSTEPVKEESNDIRISSSVPARADDIKRMMNEPLLQSHPSEQRDSADNS